VQRQRWKMGREQDENRGRRRSRQDRPSSETHSARSFDRWPTNRCAPRDPFHLLALVGLLHPPSCLRIPFHRTSPRTIPRRCRPCPHNHRGCRLAGRTVRPGWQRQFLILRHWLSPGRIHLPKERRGHLYPRAPPFPIRLRLAGGRFWWSCRSTICNIPGHHFRKHIPPGGRLSQQGTGRHPSRAEACNQPL